MGDVFSVAIRHPRDVDLRTGVELKAGERQNFRLSWRDRVEAVELKTEDDSARPLPRGTVTLLLADVEGWTGLWEANPVGMKKWVPRFDALIDESIVRHGGVRPREQGEGDSFVAAFSRASDAVVAAIDIQVALLKEEWETRGVALRIALNTGEVEVRDDTNYIGQTLNRCGRLRDLAYGGQTLVSQSTYEIASDSLPDAVTLRDIGRHRLRDLARSERVYQLCHPDLPDKFPPLRSLDVLPNNLPLQLTSFVGRTSEIAEIEKLRLENRLITLTGAGGCGKTRLALQIGAEVIDDHPDGVWWIDLAPITDPELVAASISRVLAVSEVKSEPIVETLVNYIRGRRLFLVLDNCEHLVEVCAELASRLTRSCPELWILATSREPLGVEGEISFRVPSLAFPRTDPNSVEDLVRYDSVSLFVDRAKRVRLNFEVTTETAGAVARICRRVDGIPLAIELAAARTRMLSPSQIEEALAVRFDLLTGGARTALARQRTLEASVDWSYGLLDDQEKTLLARLSVFAGGFSLTAAEETSSGGGIDRYQVLDLLSGLVDKSLVQVEDSEPEARYRLLETVRAYARQKLTDSGEATEVRSAHLDYYVALAERAGPDMRGGGGGVLEYAHQRDSALAERVVLRTADRGFAEWFELLKSETDNLRAAMGWALASGQAEKHLRIFQSLSAFWNIGGLFTEVRLSMEAALAGAKEPAVRARALSTAAFISMLAGDYRTAAQHAEECVELAREIGDLTSLGRGLANLGLACCFMGRGGLDYIKEARKVAEAAGDWGQVGISFTWHALMVSVLKSASAARPFMQAAVDAQKRSAFSRDGLIAIYLGSFNYWLQGDFAEARRHLERTLEIARSLGSVAYEAYASADLAWVAVSQGNYEEARALIDAAVRLSRDVGGDPELNALCIRGMVMWALGDPGAYEGLGEVISVSQRMGNLFYQTMAMVWAGAVALQSGDLETARTQLGEVLKIARESSFQWQIGRGLHQVSRLDRTSGGLSASESSAHETLRTMSPYGDQAGVCDVLESLGGLAAELDSREEATRLFGAAARLRQEIGYVRLPAYREGYEADVAKARSGLDEEEFDRAWKEGFALTMEEAITYAARGRGERKRPSSGWESLTPSELDVVRLVAQGLSNPEIAKRLFIARNTVKVHLSHVFAKLGISSRSELAAEATRRDV